MPFLDIGPKIVLNVEFCQSSLELLLCHVEFATPVQAKEELEYSHALCLKLLHEFPSGLQLSISFLVELPKPSF